MRPRTPSGTAHQSDKLPALHIITFLHMDLPEVCIQRLEVFIVFNDHASTVSAFISGKSDYPAPRGFNAVTHLAFKIYAAMKFRTSSCERVTAIPIS